MPSITFIDTEIEPNSGKIFDIGSVNESGSLFHSNSIADFIKFLQGSQYICGHNIFNHDLKYLEKVINDTGINKSNFIDTLFLPPLLFPAKPYHGKMDKQEKSENQDVFIKGDVQIMVATSAFGMGVDKKDIGMVIHYDISDSLEIYVQEAGRAGRDENISADCFVLFNDEDLNKHFILLNQTKINIREIQQIWKAIKNITKFRQKASRSALEIARQAGWDDSIDEIETRVKTAIAALEEAGYIKRGQNMPRVYANSILAKNAIEAINKINASDKLNEKQKENAIRIIRKLISSKSRKHISNEEAEARIDYISDHLGIEKEDVTQAVYFLREEGILADAKDLMANPRNKYLSDLEIFIRESKLEDFYAEKMDTILVSTIHKAKGREFDNVFLMLDKFDHRTDEAARQLYVAMTRAKRNLIIHYNDNYLDNIKTQGLERVYDEQVYLPPTQLAIQLTYKDIWLDSLLSCQSPISQLNSGDELMVDGDCCRNLKGQMVLKFSKQFMKKIEDMKQKKYVPKTAKINFIVYWQRENSEYQIRIVLPEVYFVTEGDIP